MRSGLAKVLAGQFDTLVRQRGYNYYWQGAVHLERGSPTAVDARVTGSRPYRVSINLARGVLSAWCECPYFSSGDLCKHLWAVILAAGKQGHLSDAVSSHGVVLANGESIDDGQLDLYDEDYEALASAPNLAGRHLLAPPKPPPIPAWQRQLEELVNASRQPAVQSGAAWPARRQILYIVDLPSSETAGNLILGVNTHDRKMNGDWTATVPISLTTPRIGLLPDADDRAILSALVGGIQSYGWGYSAALSPVAASYQLTPALAGSIMPAMCRTARCYYRLDKQAGSELHPLVWDEAGAWQVVLAMQPDRSAGWTVAGILRRGDERLDVKEARLVTGGLVLTGKGAAPLADGPGLEWIPQLRRSPRITAPNGAEFAVMAALLAAPGTPPLEVPEELRFEEITVAPRPCLRIRSPYHGGYGSKPRGTLAFEYAGRTVGEHDGAGGVFEPAERRYYRRDGEAERAAAGLLVDSGLKFKAADYRDPEPGWEIAATKVPAVVRALIEAGWLVEADGKTFRRAGAFKVEVVSGVDWFDLHADVEYGETSAKLPELLAAVKRGDNMVRLDDGTYGMLPEEWLRQFGLIAAMGASSDGRVRFRRSQAGILDALLMAQPEARCDETFARVREELRNFHGVEAAEQPAGFSGTLRHYQLEGVGWMDFLRRYSLGGCLADDMGVGKTAQVLALLENRRVLRASGEQVGPSLVVVPKSLIFNWKQEAERFTPQLRVLDYTGMTRSGNGFDKHDVVLTTYGTLRRDAIVLKDVEFDYVVLDEAQAVKNASSESAKAVRLVKGNHRLALSGTPVENHLGELWSLFEFLNPGMLGAASVFQKAGGAARNPGEETRSLLAHALRPFILRRTKQQVARELPAKTEQTIYCEMEPAQRALYDELRRHYRDALLNRVAKQGLAKSKLQVLEALLRLRQAACHPGLLDPKRNHEPSAKLEVLFEQLREVIDEGHKALVFSQFTTLLAIVRERLDAEGTVYEYLDGKTHDRQARVERFQNDPDCPLFLISLKAGGLGLNLTAAEYVFLLDPWWNPAVEAQAVDRAHRIGQTRQVFAYRLIAKDTVEEKVLELQKSKRDLAAAIIGDDNSLIRDLQREDLELLLS